MPRPITDLFRSYFRRRPGFRGVSVAVALALMAACPSPATAQAPPPGGAATPAADPVTVLIQINDLGLLKALLPLQLTQEQTTRILALLRAVAEEGKKRAKQDEDELRALSAEVARARAAALAGTPVPAELETRIQKIGQAAEARAKQAKGRAVGIILGGLKTILTPEQRRLVIAQSEKANQGRLVPAQYRADPSKAPKEVVDDMMVASFADKVLLNERAINVLSEMKPPSSAAAVSEGAQP